MLIPNVNLLTQQLTEIEYPSRTYKIQHKQESKGITQLSITTKSIDIKPEDMDRINGYIDNMDAVIQAIYLILMTERYKFIIYSWDYGVELVDLFGKPMSYVMLKLQSRIKEALTMDDRIDDVTDFEFETTGKQLHTTFLVHTNIGSASVEMEVKV